MKTTDIKLYTYIIVFSNYYYYIVPFDKCHTSTFNTLIIMRHNALSHFKSVVTTSIYKQLLLCAV